METKSWHRPIEPGCHPSHPVETERGGGHSGIRPKAGTKMMGITFSSRDTVLWDTLGLSPISGIHVDT